VKVQHRQGHGRDDPVGTSVRGGDDDARLLRTDSDRDAPVLGAGTYLHLWRTSRRWARFRSRKACVYDLIGACRTQNRAVHTCRLRVPYRSGKDDPLNGDRLTKLRKKQQRALHLSLLLRGSEHIQTAAAQVNLADTLRSLGRFVEARDMLRAASRTPLSADSDEIVKIYAGHHLSHVLWDLGERDEAIRVLEELVSFCRRARGDRDRETADAMATLTKDYAFRDRFDDALGAAATVLAANPLGGGAELPATLMAIQSVANVRWELGEFELALSCQREVVAGWRRTRGERYPMTMVTGMMLASRVSQTGDNVAALSLGEPILGAARKALGEDDEATALCRIHIARIYQVAGRTEEANDAVDAAVSRFYRRDLPKADALISRWSFCGEALYLLGRYEEARTLQEDALRCRVCLLGEAEPISLKSGSALALTLRSLGELEEARDLQEQVLAAWTRGYGAGYFRVHLAMQQLSVTLGELHEFQEGSRVAESALRGLREAYGDLHRWTAEARESMDHLRKESDLPLRRDAEPS
jgi:tetratricopeptide (TPR) repeat protein